MAKMFGFTGKVSGKMGSAVFRVRDGQQVVTQYNPIVKNPNTEAQQSNRAAFKLMSQLAAVMSPALGGFGTLGVTKRPARGKSTQRNAFLQKNYPLVETDVTSDGVVAKVPMEQLDLTGSFRPIGQIDSFNVRATGPNGSADLTMSGIPTLVSSVRVILVAYVNDANTNKATAEVRQITDYPISVAGELDEQIHFTHNTKDSADYTVLVYGLIPSDSSAISTSLDNIHTPDDEDFISAVVLESLVKDGSLSVTQTIGSNATIA